MDRSGSGDTRTAGGGQVTAIPRWLIALVIIVVIFFLLNATHLLNIHFGVSADTIWPNRHRL